MLKNRIVQIQKRLWVVVLITILTTLAAVLTTINQEPTYAGKSTLIVSSPGRTPEQDSILVAGYAALFNDPATTSRLRANTDIPDDVDFQAQLAAASPILTIQATADSPEAAQDASLDMANLFRNDVNSVRRTGSAAALAELQAQLDQLRSQPGPVDSPANAQITALQDQIATITFDSTNQLQDLQPQAGVTSDSPNIVQNVALGVAGGLVLGVLAALGLAAMSTRLTSLADLEDKTGVKPLVEFSKQSSARRDRLSGDRLAQLANVVSYEKGDGPLAVAFTDVRGARNSRDLAGSVAQLWAKQGRRTVLIDTGTSADGDTRGFADALADSGKASVLLADSNVANLKVLSAGGFVSDRNSLVTAERVSAVLAQLASVADMIVIAAPAVADTAEAPLLCAAADRTILVVGRHLSKTADVTSAVGTLHTAHAVVLGAVLVGGSDHGADGGKRRRSGDSGTGRRAADAPATSADSATEQLSV